MEIFKVFFFVLILTNLRCFGIIMSFAVYWNPYGAK